MSRFPEFGLAFRFAFRELRGGIKGFRLFLACLALGVAAISAVGSLTSSITSGMERDGQALLGGDIEFRLTHREATTAEREWLEDRGRLSETAQMRAMVHARNGNDASGNLRALIELKAVDGLYPLYGMLELSPQIDPKDAFALRDGVAGAVAEATLLYRLKLKVGDRVSVNDATFEIRAEIKREPDRATEGLTLGPRLMIGLDALPSTGLVQPGSLIYWHYRLALPGSQDMQSVVDAAKASHDDAGWRVRDWRTGSPAFRQFLDRIGIFLVLTGLTTLVVGGVGMASAVAGHLEGKTASIATLKAIGATGRFVFLTHFIQVLVLATFGILIGLALGAGLPAILVGALSTVLPVPMQIGLYPLPLALAALYGLLVTIAFSLWPLARAREVPPSGLFRDLVSGSAMRPKRIYLWLTLAAFMGLACIAVLTTGERRLALIFVGAVGLTFMALALLGRAVIWIASRLPRPHSATLRLAIANLHRPGATAPRVILSLGMCLALLVTIASIEGNLVRQVTERMPDEAPAFFFVDIQTDQLADFASEVQAVKGAGEIESVPSLRGRIVRVNGVPAEQINVSSEQRWVLRGDRGLTYAAEPPPGTRITSGEWWPRDYAGPPLISLEEGAANGLGLKLNDSLTINVLGRDIEARIANLRKVDWSSMGINFVIVFAPGALEGAPHTHLATVKAGSAAEDLIWRRVTDRFPNITAIRMKEVLVQINGLVDQIGDAIRWAAAVTLAAGLLVLSGAIMAGHRRRVRDAVLLKVLGATRAQVLRAYLAEYALLGLLTALIAMLLGTLAASVVITFVMNATFALLPLRALAVAGGGAAVTILFGLGGAWAALQRRPAAELRHA